MRNIHFVVLAIISVIGLLVWYFEPLSDQKNDNFITKSQQQAPQVTQQDAKTAKLKMSKSLKAWSETDPVPTEKQFLQMIADNPKAKKTYEFGKAKNRKVYFYGRVVDQHGDPVINAKVRFSVSRWGYLDSNAHFYDYKTNSEGRFSIEGVEGFNLGFENIEKEGYERPSKLGGFRGVHRYPEGNSANVPLWTETSKDHPWTFQLWKKIKAEPLIYSEKRLYVPFDGTVTSVALTSSGSADLKVFVTRSGSRHAPSDWQVGFEGVGGGLLESNAVFMNQAPEEGYKRRVEISYKRDVQNFVSRTDRKFFLKAKGGQVYAKLEIQIRPFFNDQESAVFIRYWLNPNGSRNLQYDPSKRIPLK